MGSNERDLRVSSNTAEGPRKKEGVGFMHVSPEELGWHAESPVIGVKMPLVITKKRDQDLFLALQTQGYSGYTLRALLHAATYDRKDRNVPSYIPIEADWDIFQRAKEGSKKADSLRKRHENDPEIGTTMKEFGNRVESWRAANNNSIRREVVRGERIISQLPFAQIIDGRFSSQVLQEIREGDSREWVDFISGQGQKIARGMYSLRIFNKFLDSHQLIDPTLRYKVLPDSTNIFNPIREYDEWHSRASKYLKTHNGSVFTKYLEWLALPEQEKVRMDLVGTYVASHRHSPLIDISRQDKPVLYPLPYWESIPAVSFVDDRHVRVERDGVSSLLTYQQIDGRVTAIDTTLSPEFLGHCLFPVVAWRKGENGKREFLTLDEIKEQFGSALEGIVPQDQIDDFLGIVSFHAFSLTRLVKTPERAPLHHITKAGTTVTEKVTENDTNAISVSQIPVWHNTPVAREALAEDPDGLLKSIEERLGTAPSVA